MVGLGGAVPPTPSASRRFSVAPRVVGGRGRPRRPSARVSHPTRRREPGSGGPRRRRPTHAQCVSPASRGAANRRRLPTPACPVAADAPPPRAPTARPWSAAALPPHTRQLLSAGWPCRRWSSAVADARVPPRREARPPQGVKSEAGVGLGSAVPPTPSASRRDSVAPRVFGGRHRPRSPSERVPRPPPATRTRRWPAAAPPLHAACAPPHGRGAAGCWRLLPPAPSSVVPHALRPRLCELRMMWR